MWPFKPKRPVLTSEGFLRWLRAEKPPLVDFLRLSEIEQEHLADLGDMWRAELVEHALGVSTAAEQPAQDEASLARGLAASMAERILQGQGARRPPESFAGFGDRRRAQAQKAQEKHDQTGAELFGRKPDAPSPSSIPEPRGQRFAEGT